MAGCVPYVGRSGGAPGADSYGDQPGHRDLGMRRIASDEDYAYGAKAEVFFEVFGLGEKLKAWEKAKIVRAPVCQCGRAKRGRAVHFAKQERVVVV